jgi:hypothetical protein
MIADAPLLWRSLLVAPFLTIVASADVPRPPWPRVTRRSLGA